MLPEEESKAKMQVRKLNKSILVRSSEFVSIDGKTIEHLPQWFQVFQTKKRTGEFLHKVLYSPIYCGVLEILIRENYITRDVNLLIEKTLHDYPRLRNIYENQKSSIYYSLHPLLSNWRRRYGILKIDESGNLVMDVDFMKDRFLDFRKG